MRTYAAIVLLICGVTGAAHAADGPTPYPLRKEDWPGTGVVRVFDWMMENRRTFWKHREQARGSIVFAGDSLTAQWRTLQQDFAHERVANRGIGGDVSRGLLFRFREDVLSLQPRAIVILIGTNDLTARQRSQDTLSNIAAMRELAAQSDPAPFVVLCTVPPSSQPRAPVDEHERAQLNEGLRELAKRHERTALVDLDAAVATPSGEPEPRYFQQDRLHLSAAGHARWRELVIPTLRAAGVLSPS